MIRNRDIIVVGLQPWDIRIGSNCKNIALEFAKSNRVLYVNAPMDLHTRWRHKKEPYIVQRLEIIKSGDNLLPVGNNIWNLYPKNQIRSINWLPENAAFHFFNRQNNRRFAADIREAIQKLGFRDFILFNDSDMMRSFYLDELLKPVLSVYYSRDNLMAVDYWYKHGHVLEPALMKKSSVVVANSKYLSGLAQQYNPRSFYVGQGCNLSVFDPAMERAVPTDIAAIQKPVIGYIGAIVSQRLDLDLLLELCDRKKEWRFVFVGKADEDFRNSALAGFDNVHFLGLKEERLLPDYLACFDVAINPQKISAMTIGNYPRKIDEYLAMGKPVVATETETMSIFRDFVYLGKTASDYAQLIERALEENNAERERQRIAFARTHTWENSVAAIYEAMLKAMEAPA